MVRHPQVQGNTSGGPEVGLREGLPLLEGPVSSGSGRKRPPRCQLHSQPPQSPWGISENSEVSVPCPWSSGQRVAELGLLEGSLPVGGSLLQDPNQGAHSFDPAVGPSGSVPGLLAGEGAAAGSTAQEAGAGQATALETGPQTGSHRLWFRGWAGGEPCPPPLRAPRGVVRASAGPCVSAPWVTGSLSPAGASG